jgi:hypothetical protein
MKILSILWVLLVPALALASPQDVARNLFPKTVMLTMKDSQGRPTALGSGFIIPKGYIVTNFHVVEGASSGFIKRAGDRTKYRITGIVEKNEAVDLVILAVDGMPEEGVKLSDRKSIEVGETVFALGNPRGLEGTFSQGIVSSVRELDDLSLLQITAPISPGSSGGPIADEKGEVVGVAVATFRGGQNLNFAIPAKYVKNLETTISSPKPLAESSNASKTKSFFESMQSGKSTDGVIAGSFLWDGSTPGATLGSDGGFTLTLRNNLDTTIRTPIILILFYDQSGSVIDFTATTFDGLIPAGMAKRVSGSVDPSTKQLTTLVSRSNHFMYSDRPATKIEYRTLTFSIED